MVLVVNDKPGVIALKAETVPLSQISTRYLQVTSAISFDIELEHQNDDAAFEFTD